MRRVPVALLSAAVLTLAVMAPASAAKPDHSRPGPLPPIELAAGEVCDFAVTLSTPVDRSKTSVWEFEDGTVRILARGYAEGTATNTEDGISSENNGGFRSEVILHPDGSVDVRVSGTFFAWYLPGDPIAGLSASLYAVHGRGSERYAPDGTLVGATFRGQSTDLCQSLAPAG